MDNGGQRSPQEDSRVDPWVAREEAEDVSDEAYLCRRITTPIMPSSDEVDEHNTLGHVIYRSWCPHCVADRAYGQRHTKVEEEDPAGAKPTVLSDYGYMNGAGVGQESEISEATGAADDDNLPILVLKDKQSKAFAASYVPAKGCEPFATKFFAAFVQRMGHREFINKSDGEHSLKALKEKAAEVAGARGIPEESPVGDSKANGEIESGVKEIKGMMRSVRSDLESKLKMVLDRRDPLLAWLPTYVADMISRHRIGKDGRTAERRRTGRNWRRPAFQFGELIFVRTVMPKAERAKRGSYEMMMREGRYLGHHGRTGALLVMTEDGIIRGSGARRVPEERRWSTEGWDRLKGLPWEVRPMQRRTGRNLASGKDAEPLSLPSSGAIRVLPSQERRMYVTRADIQRFGETPGCPGCTCIAMGGCVEVAHNDQCRMRIGQLLEQSEEGRRRLEAHRRKRRNHDLAVSPARSTLPRIEEEVERGAEAMEMEPSLAVSPARLRHDEDEQEEESKKKKLKENAGGQKRRAELSVEERERARELSRSSEQ